MALRMSISGINGVQGQLRSLVKNFTPEVQAALMEEMEIERQEVIQRIPKDTTALASSTHLIEGDNKGRKQKNVAAATILVGDDTINPKTNQPTKEYAAQVHEDMEANHPRGGQAKYLESVLKESSPHMAKRIARRLDLKRMANG
jgi:hypothetical protein